MASVVDLFAPELARRHDIMPSCRPVSSRLLDVILVTREIRRGRRAGIVDVTMESQPGVKHLLVALVLRNRGSHPFR